MSEPDTLESLLAYCRERGHVDAVVKKPDGTFVEEPINARSKHAVIGHAALFAAMPHEPRTPDRLMWMVWP